MNTVVDISQTPPQKSSTGVVGPRLTGMWQRIAVAAWAVLFILSLLSSVLSIASLNIWDRVPAADLPRYFPGMTQEAIAAKTALQGEVIQMGFSLAGFAHLLTAFRIIGSLPLFILSLILVRRYPRLLLAVLFAGLLAVMGASGVWNNNLFNWAAALAPWMAVPSQVLGMLLWFGLIFLYAFPDGRFTPRWTVGLVILLIPMVIALIFDLPVFINPDTWPNPLQLLPNLVFIGVAFFSVLYRYRSADPVHKERLKGFVLGVSLLMILYFILYFLIDVYEAMTGQPLFQTNRSVLTYVLISEPLWFVLELVFVIGTARSLFHDRLLEA